MEPEAAANSGKERRKSRRKTLDQVLLTQPSITRTVPIDQTGSPSAPPPPSVPAPLKETTDQNEKVTSAKLDFGDLLAGRKQKENLELDIEQWNNVQFKPFTLEDPDRHDTIMTADPKIEDLFDRQDKLFDQIENHFEMKKRFENVKKIEASYAEQKENAIKLQEDAKRRWETVNGIKG